MSTSDLVISAQNLSKHYLAFSSPKARVLHSLFGARTQAGVSEVRALHDVSFEMRRGEAIGIIGRNGGGKSTLLQIIAGTLAPTSGQVRVGGRISAMLELGSGFNPEYSGRDNVILNGLLLGFSRDEILDRFDEVKAFADIGEVIDRPVKTYSSGMLMRLAFAVQVLGKPDVLIVDEALSVGDFFFQQKCLSHIRKLREEGMTLLLVSHDLSTVRDMCTRALYLRQGELQFDGDTRVAVNRYFAERPATASGLPTANNGSANLQEGIGAEVLRDAVWRAEAESVAQTQPAILAVALYDEAGDPGVGFKMASQASIKVLCRPPADEPAYISIALMNKYGQTLSVIVPPESVPPLIRTGQLMLCAIKVQLMIEAGNYSMSVAMGVKRMANRATAVASTGAIGPISVHWNYETDPSPFLGLVGLPASTEFQVTSMDGVESSEAR